MKKKIAENLEKIKELIVDKYKPEKIILFGSYAWGKPNKDSDFDLFVIKKSNKTRRQRQIDVQTIIFGSDMPVDVLVYTPKEIGIRLDINDMFIKKIINTGKVAYAK